MKPLVELYKEKIQDAEPVGDYVNDNVAIATSFMCLEDGDAARDWMTRSRNGRQQSLVFKYLDTFPKPPGIPDWPQEIPDPSLEQLEKGFEKGTSIVGTPEQCTEALEKWDAIGVDQLIMGPTGTAYPFELVEETVELFGTKVIPHFDTDPEPRSAKHRRLARRTGRDLASRRVTRPRTARCRGRGPDRGWHGPPPNRSARPAGTRWRRC